MGEGNSFSLFTFRGGVPIQPWMGGGSQVSDFRGGGGSQVSDFFGGGRSQIFGVGVPGLRFLEGGVPGLSKGKNF